MAKTIIVEITEEAAVTIKTEGFGGTTCLENKDVKDLKDLLGAQVSFTPTEEMKKREVKRGEQRSNRA